MPRGTSDKLKNVREMHNDTWRELTGWPRGVSYFSGWQEITALTTKMQRAVYASFRVEEITPEFVLEKLSPICRGETAERFATDVSNLFFKYVNEIREECLKGEQANGSVGRKEAL